MRIINVDREFAEKAVKEAVDHEIGVFEDNTDIAQQTVFGTNGNPIRYTAWYNPATSVNGVAHTCTTGGDSHVAADITSYMNAYNDPRREKYFIKSEWDGAEYTYCGIRRGIVRPAIAEEGHRYSGINLTAQSPLVWMNAAEVAFLKAEAAAVYNITFADGGSAQSYYEQGIRLSFSQWGAEGADAYIAQNSPVSVSYDDPWTSDNPNGTVSNISAPAVAWDDAASPEEKQQRIITQKWIANFILGNEAWADYRRTGYPVLFPASDAGNLSRGVVDSNRGARRMPYPQSEYTNNPYMSEAVTMLGDADDMGTDLWWAKKD